MKKSQMTAPAEFKFDEAQNTFTGYASVFNNVDGGGDIVRPGAFSDDVVAIKRGGRAVPILWQHDATDPIGIIRDAYEDEKGLVIEAELADPEDVPRAKQARSLMIKGAVSGLSIGYSTLKESVNRALNVRELLKLKLWETSVVTFPMNALARIVTVKADDIHTKRDFEESLVEIGFSRNAAKGIASRGFQPCDARDEPQHTSDLRDAIEENSDGIKALASLVKSFTK